MGVCTSVAVAPAAEQLTPDWEGWLGQCLPFLLLGSGFLKSRKLVKGLVFPQIRAFLLPEHAWPLQPRCRNLFIILSRVKGRI